MLKHIFFATALTITTVFVAGTVADYVVTAQAQQRRPAKPQQQNEEPQVLHGQMPQCEPAEKVVADFKELEPTVEAHVFTRDEVAKLVAWASNNNPGSSMDVDTIAVMYLAKANQAIIIYGTGGVVCNFVVAPEADVRRMINQALGQRV